MIWQSRTPSEDSLDNMNERLNLLSPEDANRPLPLPEDNESGTTQFPADSDPSNFEEAARNAEEAVRNARSIRDGFLDQDAGTF